MQEDRVVGTVSRKLLGKDMQILAGGSQPEPKEGTEGIDSICYGWAHPFLFLILPWLATGA